MFCLGLFAASCLTGFAQAENVTSKVKNADFEWGVAHWDITFDNQIWGKNVNKAKQNGFYGFEGTNLEVWNGSVLAPNSVSQQITDLPNGTYVFGAYLAASYHLATPAQPTKAEGVTDEEYKASAEYKEWKAEYDAIRAKFVADSVYGVSMFANADTIPVATEHPDRAELKRHTVKFNIATQVTDGNLRVGLNVDSTNAIYVCWDELELYYFGDMAPEAALNEMAKIDAQKPVLVADTVKGKHINVDTLAYLNEGYAAIAAVETPADFAAADELLRWGVVLANRSYNDYEKLRKQVVLTEEKLAEVIDTVANCEDLTAGEWLMADNQALVEGLIAEAQTAYDGKEANRAEINALVDTLSFSRALIEHELLYVAYMKLDEFVNEHSSDFGDEVGMYPLEWQDSLDVLLSIAAEIVESKYLEDVTADVREDAKWAKIINASLAACENSKVVEHEGTLTAMPLATLTGDPALGTNVGGDVYEFKSETYTAAGTVTGMRITFLDTYCPNGAGKGNPVFVALAEFYLYDGEGNQITLSEGNFSTNAQEATEGPMAHICDGDNGTFWHSDWHGSVQENHYLEVTFPGGLDLTSFSFGWRSRNNRQNIPAKVDVSIMTYVNQGLSNLTTAINDAKNALASFSIGKGIGSYQVDLTAFNEALAHAEYLAENGVEDESEYGAAADALVEAQNALYEAPMNLPEPGKQYRVISAGPFFASQGVHKALTVYSDSTVTDQVWWENAGKDSLEQLFTFEPVEYVSEDEEEVKYFFSMKHVATGRYVGAPVVEVTEGDDAGTFKYGNTVELFESPDTIVELVSLGEGQVALHDKAGRFHAGSHNGGAASTSAGAYGGINGVYSAIVHWNAGVGSASAWYICEMNELPLTALIEGEKYESPLFHLYENVGTFAVVADKESAFDNFVLKGIDGQVIEGVQLDVMGSSLLVTLDEPVWAFSFSFDNNEGVSQVVISESKLGNLREAYNEALAVGAVEGDNVGEVADMSEFNAAIAQAEELLAKGGDDAAVEAAVAALEKAVEGLVYNKPVEGKVYMILSALEAYEENHGVPMALYAKTTADGDFAKWAYIANLPTHQWQFVAVSDSSYKIQNVATTKYLTAVEQSTNLAMTESAEDAGSYFAKKMGGTSYAFGVVGGTNYQYLHCGGHSNGAGKAGNIVGWEPNAGVSQWKVFDVETVLTDLDFTEVEEEEVVVKGIYDLFGRRVINPVTPGIYIIDGKKRVIK